LERKRSIGKLERFSRRVVYQASMQFHGWALEALERPGCHYEQSFAKFDRFGRVKSTAQKLGLIS
jgi:hypothetical protein